MTDDFMDEYLEHVTPRSFSAPPDVVKALDKAAERGGITLTQHFWLSRDWFLYSDEFRDVFMKNWS